MNFKEAEKNILELDWIYEKPELVMWHDKFLQAGYKLDDVAGGTTKEDWIMGCYIAKGKNISSTYIWMSLSNENYTIEIDNIMVLRVFEGRVYLGG